MAKRKFKTESKRILDLMINSIYTHKEIFLREIISNASDAMDKRYFQSLNEKGKGMSRSEFGIRISADKDARTLSIRDNGIGMSAAELEDNLGTIAHSGSLEFKNGNELGDDVDIIGQFGVGFYSAFMVASSVTVLTRPDGGDVAYEWQSDGADGYTIKEAQRDEVGTTVTLALKPDTEQEKYSEFLDQYRLSNLVKKYSDYIRYPIVMQMTRSKLKEGSESEYETVVEDETLNSMVPLWRRNKKDVKPEEYNDFYKTKFLDYEDPQRVIVQKTEGSATFNALLYIPARAPFNYYTKEYEKGLELYSSGVMITEKCRELLPDCFSFVRGLVDSEDLSLNISREMLQHDRQLKLIAATIEKRIKKELADMRDSDRAAYEEFWANFGLQLKFGVYSDFGAKKELLEDLLLFYSAKEKKLLTLDEYVAAMPEKQKYIYYAAGDSVERLSKLPAAERVLGAGFDLLLLSDEVDEFALQVLHAHQEKEFRSVSAGELELGDESEKQQTEQTEKDNKELLDALKDALGDKVSAVKVSARLLSYPVCLSSQGPVSIEMEKVLNAMPGERKVNAERVLELNAQHPVFDSLKKLHEQQDGEKIKKYAELLYDQACLIEGLPVEDPAEFSKLVCELM